MIVVSLIFSNIVKWFLVSHSSSYFRIVKKGKSHLLLKSAINKKRNELQRQNEEEKDGQREAIEILQEEITSLKKELLERDKVIDEYENDSEILKSLYNKGIIDLDGNVIE